MIQICTTAEIFPRKTPQQKHWMCLVCVFESFRVFVVRGSQFVRMLTKFNIGQMKICPEINRCLSLSERHTNQAQPLWTSHCTYYPRLLGSPCGSLLILRLVSDGQQVVHCLPYSHRWSVNRSKRSSNNNTCDDICKLKRQGTRWFRITRE